LPREQLILPAIRNCCTVKTYKIFVNLDHRGHYFRKLKKEFDQTIEAFVKSLRISPEYIDELMDKIQDAFDKQQLVVHQDAVALDLSITDLRNQVSQVVNKIKFLSSETAIKYMEADIV
jgi:hypothetical protein